MNYTDIFIDDIRIELPSGDILIPITYSLTDTKNIGAKSGNKTKTVTVPATAFNNKVFGIATDINAYNSFDKFSPHKVRIEENREVIFSGECLLTDVTRKTISFFCYSGVSRLKAIAQNKSLQDLNLSDLDHTYDETIFDTWDGSYPVEVAPDYIYIPIDYGNFYGDNPLAELYKIKVTDLFPSVFLYRIIRQIALDNNLTLVSTFFSDPVQASIVIPFTNEKFVHTLNGSIETTGFMGIGVRREYMNGTTGDETIQIPNEIYDPLNQWDNTTWEYEAASPQNVIWNLRLFIETGNGALVASEFIITEFWDGATWTEIGNVPLENSFWLPQRTEIITGNYSLGSGQKIRFRLSKTDPDTVIFIDPKLLTFDNSDGVILEDETVQLAPNLPDITQADFMKWCANIFNWIIDISDETGVMRIETAEYFFKDNTSVDMSDRMSLTPDPIIKYGENSTGRRYLFNYTQDPDDYYLIRANGLSRSVSALNFGDGELNLTESGEVEVIENGFSPTIVGRSFNGGSHYIELPMMIKQINPEFITAHTPRILIYAGMVDLTTLSAGEYSTIDTDNGDYSQLPFAYFQKRRYNDPDLDGIPLNLSYSINYSKNEYLPGNVIDEYWKDYVLMLANSSRVVAFFALNASDVSNIDLSKYWYVSYFEAFFIINKITDYLPGKQRVTKVELTKVGTTNLIDVVYG